MTDKSQDQAHPQTVTVPLDTPLQQGDQKITSVTLRRPLGGALRGVKLVDLYNMDVIAVSKVVPRISTPVITEQEYLSMPGEDCAAIAGEITAFLLSKKQRLEAGLT